MIIIKADTDPPIGSCLHSQMMQLRCAHAPSLSRLRRRCRCEHGDEGAPRDDERGDERAVLGRQRQQAAGRRSDHRRLPGTRDGREEGLYLPAAPQ